MAVRVRPDGSAEQPGTPGIRTNIPSVSPGWLHTHKTLCSQPVRASPLCPSSGTFLAPILCLKSPALRSLPKSWPARCTLEPYP